MATTAKPLAFRRSAILLAVLATPAMAMAGEWTITPRVEAMQMATDNLFLTDKDRESELVTGITPGITVKAKGRRFNWDLDYAVENLVYASNSEYNATNQQLRTLGKVTLLDDYLYLDAGADAGQRLSAFNNQRGIDNVNVVGDRIDYQTYHWSPSLRHDFGGWVRTDVRYREQTYQDNYGDELPGVVDQDGNGMRSLTANVSSSREFNRFLWGLNHSVYEYERASGLAEGDVATTGLDRRAESSVNLSYYFSRQWAALANAGDYQNEIGGLERENNGNYWTAGIGWTPNRKFSLQMLSGGDNRQANLVWAPTTRSNIRLAWQDMSVGTITGPSWDLDATHRSRRTTWTAKYSESLVSQQQLLLGEKPFSLPDPSNPNGPPIVVPLPFYSLAEENFLRKNAQIGVRYKRGRNALFVRLFDEQRSYELNEFQNEKYSGIDAGIDFGLGAHSLLGLQTLLDRRDFEFLERTQDYYTVRSRFEHQLSPLTRVEFSVSHTASDSDSDSGPFFDNRLNYRENRIMATLTKAF